MIITVIAIAIVNSLFFFLFFFFFFFLVNVLDQQSLNDTVLPSIPLNPNCL